MSTVSERISFQASNEIIKRIPTRLWIGGEWVDGSDGQTIGITDPATEQVIARVSSATADDVTRAIDAADGAAMHWAAISPRERAEVLRKAYELMTAGREELSAIISREEGKTRAEALGEVAYAAEFFRWYGEEAVRIAGRLGRSPAGTNKIVVQQHPIGIALLITPWNFPAAMATRKIGPALAAGCSVILKPASETPLTALVLAEILAAAGVPPGVVNVIPSASASVVSATALSDPRVRKLSFTGSTEVGRLLLARAGERVIDCSMELGGDAPFVVLDDADIDTAIEGAMVAKMRNAGESCIAANRFYVHRSRAEEFSSRFADAMSELSIGPGLDDGVDVGPLVNATTRDKVARLVDAAVSGGARVLTGGRAPDRQGYFYEPTVITDIDPDADIANTEIFGPVAPIFEFDSIDEAIAKANTTIFGLAAYVFSADVAKAMDVAGRIEAGIVGVNRGFVSDPAAPFGGMKQSGIGREGARDGIHEFLETQYVAVNW
jgi:succinate-semialdehyde dehydrogenase / glutarate-semialdehyde dehydrogenase